MTHDDCHENVAIGSDRVGIFASSLFIVLLLCALPQSKAQAAAAEPAQPGTDAATPAPQAEGTVEEELPGEPVQPGAAPPPFFFRGSLEAAQSFVTNISGKVGSTDTGSISDVRLNLALHDTGPRHQADLSASIGGQVYVGEDTDTNFSNELNALVNWDIDPEHASIFGRAYASNVFLNRLGALTANPRNAATYNTRQLYAYTVSPSLRTRVASLATIGVSGFHSGVFFVRPSVVSPAPPLLFQAPRDTFVLGATGRIESSTDFYRVGWAVEGSARETDQGADRSQSMQTAQGELNFAVTRDFQLRAMGGYLWYDSTVPLIRQLDGLIALGGFQYSPHDRLLVTAMAGTRYRFDTYYGSVRYQITPLTSFVLSIDDVVSTSQERILGGVGNIAAGPGGGFYDTGARPPPPIDPTATAPGGVVNPLPGYGLPFDNAIARFRNVRATFAHERPRTSYALTLFGAIRDQLSDLLPGIDPRQTIYGGAIDVSHDLTRQIIGYAQIGYSWAEEFGGTDDIFNVSGRVEYQITPTWSAYVSGGYVHRTTETPLAISAGTLSDAQVTLGLRYQF